MAYNFSSQGTGLKVVNTISNAEIIFEEGIVISFYTDNNGTKFVIKSVDNMIACYQTEIGTIAGAAPAGTVDGILNQLAALINASTGSGVASAVNITDPTTPAQKAAVSAAGALKVDGSAVTQPVSGSVGVSSLPALPAGSNAIGTVALNAAIPAGANAIGTVGVTSLPAIPAGANAIGTVGINASLPAGANAIGNVGVTSLPSIPAGANAIGSVSVSNFPATQPVSGTVSINPIPAGTNSIGSVSNIAANIDTAALVTLTAAAASGNSADQINTNGRGLQLGINITAITGTTPSLIVTIQGKDVASGAYYTLLASVALTAVGFTLLTVYPGAPSTANASIPQVLPKTFRILYTIAGTTPAVTATIGASIIV